MVKMSRFTAALFITSLCLVWLSSAPGAETITYTYDALGRLNQANRTGTVNNGTQSAYTYDSAGNRINATVTTPGATCLGITFTVNDVAVYEGTPLVFTITKSGAATGGCSVNYATANGSAVAPNDYTAVSGTLTFTINQTSQTVSVTTKIAGPNEPTEYMALMLSGATGGATITDSQGQGTIYNNFDGCITCLQSAPPPSVE